MAAPQRGDARDREPRPRAQLSDELVEAQDEGLEEGDWVLIHVGFAMSKIDEEEAALALASLQLMGQAYDDELEAFWSSKIASESST